MKSRLHAIFTAAVLVSAPAIASAQSTDAASPIAVEAFRAHNGLAADEATGRTHTPNTIDIAFQNNGTKPVAKVVFDIRSDGQSVGQIVDVGHFAPGAQVVHHYDNTFDGVAPLSDGSAAPVEVDYADGTVWKAAA
jgi:hypothetical protein